MKEDEAKEHWRSVFTASGDAEANAVRAFLEAEGIESELQGEALRNAIGLTVDGLGRVEVLVADVDEERARDLLASAEHGDFRLDSDAAPES